MSSPEGYGTREIKMRIVKEAFNKKISLLTSKLNIKLRKKLVRCYVCSIALYGSETWTVTKLERKNLVSFEMWCWRRMEKIKWPEKVTNEINERIGEKRTLINRILRRKVNWICYILRINCLLHDTIEGKMTEVKGVIKRTQLLDKLRNRRRGWELKKKLIGKDGNNSLSIKNKEDI